MIVNGPAILCILSPPFVFQLSRRTSQETQQVFDWFISILNFSQVFIFVVLIGSFRSYISVKCCQLLFFIQFASFTLLAKAGNSVCTCVSDVCCNINAFKSKKLCPLEVLGVERQFCCKHGQCVKMSRRLPTKKQLRLTVMSSFFLCNFSFEFSSSLKCFAWDTCVVFKLSYIFS